MRARDGAGRDRLLLTGVAGTVLAAIGCFTPAFVGLLGLVGLSALAGGLDLVLYPALGGFALLTVWALWRRRRGAACTSAAEAGAGDGPA